MSNSECGTGGVCSMNQEDSDGDGIGDACTCVVDTDCDDGLWCTGDETCGSNTICLPGTNPCGPDFCSEEDASCHLRCVANTDCDDGLWCTGDETCVDNACIPGISPCDDTNTCTTDPCDEDNDLCLAKECTAINPLSPCCSDPLCETNYFCEAKVTLLPGDILATSGEIFKSPVCLDNINDPVGGIQFDLCEYVDGQPSECMTCIDCEITERTALFDCRINELANGCCRVILFSKHPSGLINPGQCDVVKVVYEPQGSCEEPTCAVQIPENIITADSNGLMLPTLGWQGSVCFLPPDADSDGISDDSDNCPMAPNGPEGGTCISGGVGLCMSNSECGTGGVCSMNQEDSDGDGIGDACTCVVDTDCDDGLWCTGDETCVDNACISGISPCDDTNPCTTDPCDEDNDLCLAKECTAASTTDPYCNDTSCVGSYICETRVTLQPEDVLRRPGEIIDKSVCLDNQIDLVGGVQFDLCEYSNDQPIDCMTCIDCTITERTALFDCRINELANGCCRVILFSKHPSGVINPGLCDIVTVYEFNKDCSLETCALQIPENIVVADSGGLPLPATGLPGEVCLCTVDADCDDGNPCSTDTCDQQTKTCTNICRVDQCDDSCCEDPVCIDTPICKAQVTLAVEPAWAYGDVGIKVDLCLDNRDHEVGGVQVDVCDEPNCLECVGCELSERTVLFDCFVNDIDGCCRVVLISKNPGGVINPGLCNIVKIDYRRCDPENPLCAPAEECEDCITLTPEVMLIPDPYGNLLAPCGIPGDVCPFVCGDVHPAESAPGAGDCGDGDVDLMDIMEEVDIALADDADSCQADRADVPTGTPGRVPTVCDVGVDKDGCCPPDGSINIFDVMTLIDMVLDRQDCCTYYYTGVIY